MRLDLRPLLHLQLLPPPPRGPEDARYERAWWVRLVRAGAYHCLSPIGLLIGTVIGNLLVYIMSSPDGLNTLFEQPAQVGQVLLLGVLLRTVEQSPGRALVIVCALAVMLFAQRIASRDIENEELVKLWRQLISSLALTPASKGKVDVGRLLSDESSPEFRLSFDEESSQ